MEPIAILGHIENVNAAQGRKMKLDLTFCDSPNCKNKCKRQMNPEQKKFALAHPYYPISYGYFCGEPVKECEHEYESSSFLVVNCKLCGFVLHD